MPAVQAEATVINPEHLAAARKAAESDTLLNGTAKPKVLEFYDQAGKWLQEADSAAVKLAQLQAQVESAPARIEEIKGLLAAPVSAARNNWDEQPLDRLEVLLGQETLALEQKKESLKNQQDELTKLLVGSKNLGEDIAARALTIDQIDKDLKLPVADEPAVLTQARGFALKSRHLLRSNELDLLKLRLGSLNLLTNLAQAERDLLEVQIDRAEPQLDALKDRVQALREKQASEARLRAEEIKEETSELPPAISVIAQANAGYRQELEGLVLKEKTVTSHLEETRLALEEIKTDFERTRQRVEVVGPSQAIGKLLVRRREALPSLQSYRRMSADRGAEISHATDRQLEIDELLREHAVIGKSVTEALNGLEPGLESTNKLEQEATRLARIRRDSLSELQTVYGRYIAQLTTLDLVERRRVDLSEAFVDYIDEELLWIPGHGIKDLLTLASLTGTFGWVFSQHNWLEFSQDLEVLAGKNVGILLIFLGLFLLLLKNGYGAKARLESISRDTVKIRTDSFLLTLRALGLTLAVSGAWPLLMVSVGWFLGRLSSADPFSVAIAHGLVKSGWILFALHFLRQTCLPGGLGDRHLKWNPQVRHALVSDISWLLPLAVPLGFMVAVSSGHATPQAAKIPGQIAFAVLMGASSVFIYRVLRRSGPMMSAALQGDGVGVLALLHFLWFPAFLVFPMALAVVSVSGYHNASLHFAFHAEMTFWFFVALFLLKELILRYLYIAERRLRFDEALRRREELRAQREHADEAEPSPISLEIPELDFAELGDQATRLVRAGFLFAAVIGSWTIWSELLPALGFLDIAELPFQTSRVVDGVAKDVPLTLGDLVVGLIFIVITVLAAKNLPGILEITLLQRLPLDAGSRYAITALSQYAIVGIGVLMAFSHIGLQWSSIQWLVAALSVGLGFGLQEIVANFISGIILLFERPIRVGDVVTVNNTTGVVSRIRIRATTITKYDKQELLIPNKQFITAEVTNWTLSDKMNRILITVGVGYTADVDRAMALLIEAAVEQPEILVDPKPVASFEAFGDSALTLMLRCYLGSMDNRLSVITMLHRTIRDKFAAAGISIPFPQRDVHLDSATLPQVPTRPSAEDHPDEAEAPR